MSTTIKIAIVMLVLLAAVGVVAMKQVGGDASPQVAPSAAAPAKPSDAASVPAPLPAPLPHLVDLGANKCIPCKAMAPILEQLRQDFQGRLLVTFLDVWQDRAAGEAYDIRIIPTQIFLDPQGVELFRHEGFYSRQEILDKWLELGYPFDTAASLETSR
ncbi:MAG: thioredoxin family protein [Phycisphaeraceae bacterium]